MNKLYLSPSPHFKNGVTTRNIMLDVIIALMPCVVVSVILFGFKALVLYATSCAGCVLCEYISRKIMKRESTVGDLSAVVTGILLAMNVPVTLNPLIILFGSVVAIVVVKQMFGGIGQNFVNPALIARIVLLTSFPSKMTNWTAPFAYLSGSADAVSSATPLADNSNISYLKLILGAHGGCLGETCAVAIILGGIYLMLKKVISPVIPCVYLGTFAIFTLLSGNDVIYGLLSGGILLGAFFMATDYTTSPINFKGKIVFALGCGILTFVIRTFGALPEGVSFAIIIMNILVPHIETLTLTKPFGSKRRTAKNG
ncbi:MAG: RnfABCDGE type electron transport complex subunit D [Clostridiales bacterium]|nr:RnfABCDGE type electron transport complex subunit D [Clostridiales bacterium]